jgi:outer membrane protein assembly factor BamB
VLVHDETADGKPLVYFAAGRSSHLDGGIHVYALDLKTGKVLHRANVTMTASPEDGKGIIQQRALPDVLSLQKGSVFMRDLRLETDLTPGDQELPHLYAPGGFLGNAVPAGRLLVFDGGDLIYGYGRVTYRAGAGHVRPGAAKDYKLFAEVLAPKPKPQEKPKTKRRKAKPPARRREIKWSTNLPFVARSIVLTQDALLAAGGQSLTRSADGHNPAMFWITSRKDGTKQGECRLPAPPILDGMAFVESGVFVSTTDGSVVCLRSATP